MFYLTDILLITVICEYVKVHDKDNFEGRIKVISFQMGRAPLIIGVITWVYIVGEGGRSLIKEIGQIKKCFH